MLAPGLAAVALPQFAANLLAGFDCHDGSARSLHRGNHPVPLRGGCARPEALLFDGAGPRSGARSHAVGGGVGDGRPLAGSDRGDAGVVSDGYVRRPPRGVAGSRGARAARRCRQLHEPARIAPVARRYVYSVPVVGRADWIVLDRSDAWVPQAVGGYPDAAALRRFHTRIERSSRWRKVFERRDVVVFRRVES